MFTISHLNKLINNRIILKDINLTLPTTGFVVLRGENGSGKTTLLNILALLDNDYQGSVTYLQNEINSLSDSFKSKIRYNDISYCRQKNNLISFLSVNENYYLDRVLKKEKVEKKFNNTSLSSLSQGQQQLVTLKHILKPGKKVYLLDEITSSLDNKHKNKLINSLKKLAEKALVIIVSHEKELAEYANMILKLEKGQLTIIKDCNIAKEDGLEDIKSKQSLHLNLRLFYKFFKANFALHAFGVFISFLILCLIYIGLYPSLISPKDYFNSSMKTGNQILTALSNGFYDEELIKKFNDSTIKVINGTCSWTYEIYVIISDDIDDDKAHISQEYYEMLKLYADLEISNETITFGNDYYVYEDVKIEVEKDLPFYAFYVNPSNITPTRHIDFIYMDEGFWDTEEHPANYFSIATREVGGRNKKYPKPCFVNRKYVEDNNLQITLPNKLEDDTFYIYEPELMTSEITHFSVYPQRTVNQEYIIDFNKVFPNGVKIEFVDADEDHYSSNYVTISDNTLKRIRSFVPNYDNILISLTKHKEEIIDYLSNKGIKLKTSRTFLINSEYDNLEAALSNYNYAIDLKYDKAIPLWCNILAIGTIPLLFVFLIFVTLFIIFYNRNNNYLLKKEGYTFISRYLLFYLNFIILFTIANVFSFLCMFKYMSSEGIKANVESTVNIIYIITIILVTVCAIAISLINFWRNEHAK